MAALQARISSGSVALSAATAKTVLQITAPANQRVKITNLGVYFDGVTSTATPVQVQLVRQTTAGTGTSGTPVLVEKELSETIQTTGASNFSAEPTSGDILRTFSVPAFMGSYEVFYPFGQELVIQGGGRLGIVCNAPATVNARAELQFEE